MNDISLKTLESSDLEMVRNWRNLPEVSQYMYTDQYISEQDQINWFNRIKDNPTCKYWIIQYEQRSLGLVSITEISQTYDSCFWAFYLGDSSVRGAGIGAKVEYNILEFVFNELNLNKLRCEVLVSNEKVIKMHEKFGFRKEAYYRDHVQKHGVHYDVIGLAMLKRDWEQVRQYHYNRIYEK